MAIISPINSLNDDGSADLRTTAGDFGRSFAMTDDLIVVGSTAWAVNGSNYTGRAWLYNIDGTIVKQLVGDGTEDWTIGASDQFGGYVEMNEGLIAVSCVWRNY